MTCANECSTQKNKWTSLGLYAKFCRFALKDELTSIHVSKVRSERCQMINEVIHFVFW